MRRQLSVFTPLQAGQRRRRLIWHLLMCGWIFGTLMSADAGKKEDKLKDLTGEDTHVAVKQPHGGVLSATPRMT